MDRDIDKEYNCGGDDAEQEEEEEDASEISDRGGGAGTGKMLKGVGTGRRVKRGRLRGGTGGSKGWSFMFIVEKGEVDLVNVGMRQKGREGWCRAAFGRVRHFRRGWVGGGKGKGMSSDLSGGAAFGYLSVRGKGKRKNFGEWR